MSQFDRFRAHHSDDASGVDTEAVDAADPRLVKAVQEYMAAVEAGQRPSRQEWITRHPDIAVELGQCLDGLAFVQSAAATIRVVEPQAPDASDPAAAGGLPSRPLGDFRLVREIGRGGMGVVYEAEQLSLGRRVAVKVLPLAAALDPRHIQRFRNEAQAAAQLHHTHIVPVYAVGYERSVHFYAMQLIEGQSLAEVIRELREARDGMSAADTSNGTIGKSSIGMTRGARSASASGGSNLGAAGAVSPPRIIGLSGEPARNLSTLRDSRRLAFHRAAARLGCDAAEALEYAHSMGVVHRDIKPANLLLDGQGKLWITDFGLAQFYSADDGLTRSGDLLGTIRYMSPEQASGRAVVLDQRTDVYSLGVTLYELLSLERALNGETREALLAEIGTVEPQPLRSIDKTIPQELETIVAKAISKDPSDRYSTAQALADDLNRFLRDEPIRARPPALWQKAFKWARRHKPIMAAAVIVIFLAAAGFLTSTLLIAREQSKTRDAYILEQKKSAEASRERATAERNFQQARESVDYFTRIAAEEMADNPAFNDVRREMLEESLLYYQDFLQEQAGNAPLGAELSATRSKISSLLGELTTADALARSGYRISLLSEPAVRDDLQLSADQVIRADQLSAQWNDGRPDSRRPARSTTRPSQDLLAAQTKEMESGLTGLLSSKQLARLRQIAWQASGPIAFNDPVLCEALSLSHAQLDKIRAVQVAYEVKRHHPPEPGERRPGPDRFRAEAMTQIMAQLTPAQHDAWNAAMGAPFTARVRAPAPDDDRMDRFDRSRGSGGPGPGRDRGPDQGPPDEPRPGRDRRPPPPPF